MRIEFLNSDKESLNESLLIDEERAHNLTKKAEKALLGEDHYSAASYCYGANVIYRHLLLRSVNLSEEEIILRAKTYINTTIETEEKIDNKAIKTVNDLEVHIIVKERLQNARELLEKSKTSLNESNVSGVYYLANGIERLYSAFSWSSFFYIEGKEITVDEERLKESCLSKISEAEERVQYVNLFLPLFHENMKDELDKTYKNYNEEEYGLCLFRASEIKARADVILNVMGIEEEEIAGVLEKRLEIVKNNILIEQEKGNFPLLGYSFYEYAKNLEKEDQYSSLLYSEYALELSNLNMYFPKKQTKEFILEEEYYFLLTGLGVGFIWGLLCGMVIIKLMKKRPRKNH